MLDIDIVIDINIDIDNFNTDVSTMNSVHACLLYNFWNLYRWIYNWDE